MLNLRKLFIRSRDTISIDVVDTWEVRWYSRHGEFSGDVRTEVMIFVTEVEAEEFAQALKDAFKLIQHTSGTRVTVKPSTHGR